MKPIIVIGSGVAGLIAAIELLKNGCDVLLFSKDELDNCNTDKAQGGIAVVLKDNDSFESHIEDTLKAGAGLCKREAVELLVKEGPERIRELINMGADFDKSLDGSLDFTKEAAHSTNRIIHAMGDATGHAVEQTLIKNLRQFKSVEVLIHRQLSRFYVEDGRVFGALFLNTRTNEYEIYDADAIVVATGGYAAIYKNTTNPPITTGDGIAAAFMSGAVVEDMEFVQFHPTALKRYNAPQFLISESMRGEGAKLLNDRGERFMEKYHRLAELAPRDVVARSIIFEMEKRGIDKVYLDATGMGRKFLERRFPTIYNECLNYGIDITKEAIPVAPAAHYTMGGIKSFLDASTSIKGLFVAGEAACSGVHGANRLASNSILEGLVFGKIAAESAFKFAKNNPSGQITIQKPEGFRCNRLILKSSIENLKETIWNKLGVVRRIKEMEEILDCSLALFNRHNVDYVCSDGITLRNMALLASMIAFAALKRKGSVGAHYCIDTPHAYDNRQHIAFKVDDLEERP